MKTKHEELLEEARENLDNFEKCSTCDKYIFDNNIPKILHKEILFCECIRCDCGNHSEEGNTNGIELVFDEDDICEGWYCKKCDSKNITNLSYLELNCISIGDY